MGLIKETSYDARGPGCKAQMYTVRVLRRMCVFVYVRVCAQVRPQPLHVHIVSVHPDVAQTRRSFRLLCEAPKHLSTSDDVLPLFVRWLPPSCHLGAVHRVFSLARNAENYWERLVYFIINVIIIFIIATIIFIYFITIFIISLLSLLFWSAVWFSLLSKVVPLVLAKNAVLKLLYYPYRDPNFTLENAASLTLRITLRWAWSPSRNFDWEWCDATRQRIELLDWILPIPSR